MFSKSIDSGKGCGESNWSAIDSVGCFSVHKTLIFLHSFVQNWSSCEKTFQPMHGCQVRLHRVKKTYRHDIIILPVYSFCFMKQWLNALPTSMVFCSFFRCSFTFWEKRQCSFCQVYQLIMINTCSEIIIRNFKACLVTPFWPVHCIKWKRMGPSLGSP